MIAAVMHAYFRDVQPILTAALLPWFFISGVLFRLQALPGFQSHHWLESLLRWANPIAPFIEAVRSILYYGAAPSGAVIVYLIAAGAISMACGWLVFARMQGELAVVL